MFLRCFARFVLALAMLSLSDAWAKPTGDSAAYRKTLDANAKDVMAFKNLLRSLKPGDTRDDLGVRFSKLGDPGKVFNTLVDECGRTRDSAALEQIAKAMKEIKPQQLGVDSILLRAKLANGKIADATALFRAAAKGAKDPLVQKGLRDEFLQGMANAGKAIDAYRAFPGGKESFHLLADQLVANGDSKGLGELIEEHQVFLGDDPYLGVYAGQLSYESRQFADADAAWTAAFKAIKNVEIEERFQRRWFRARLALGNAFDAADGNLAAKTHVTQMANELLDCRKIDELEKLLQAYAKSPKGEAKSMIGLRLRMNRDADFATLAKIAVGLTEGRFPIITEAHSFWAESGKTLDAYKAATDPKAEFYSLGQALFIRRQFAELRRLIEVHRKAEPTDPMTTILEAEMWLEQGHAEKVIASLKDLQIPARITGAYKVKELLRHAHVQLGQGLKYCQDAVADGEAFSQVAIYYRFNRNAADLEALLAARPANGKAFFREWEYRAMAKIFAGKPSEAMAIYLPYRDQAVKQIGLQPKNAADPFGPFGGFGKKKAGGFGGFASVDREFQFAETDLLREMARIGHGLEMYRLAAYPEKAFSTLATYYRNEKNVDALEKLVAEHRRKYPTDEDLPLASAYIALWRGDLASAAGICRRELAQPNPEPKDKKEFGALFARTQKPYQYRECLLTALVRQGKTVEQYRLHGSDYAAFHRLAAVCVRENEADELDALLTAHRKSVPDDPGLKLYEAEVSFLRGNHDAAAKALLSLKDRNNDHRGKALISLVRARHVEEAVRLAKEWEADAPLREPMPTVLAYAAAGDVKETARLLAMHSRVHDHRESFYADEDLGPLLRSDAFKTVRERFPDPRKK